MLATHYAVEYRLFTFVIVRLTKLWFAAQHHENIDYIPSPGKD